MHRQKVQLTKTAEPATSRQKNPTMILGSMMEWFRGKCKDLNLSLPHFLFANHFFPLRSVNTGDPVQQLFIFHLIPSRSSASCQSWHVITTKQDPAFFSFFAAGCAASSEAPWIIYSWGSLGGTPSNSGECLRFSTQPGLPSSFYPFPRVLQGRRLEFHGC